MKKKFLILVLIIFGMNVQIFAQEVFKFFEFAPRSTDSINLNLNTVEQDFIPFNDYLSLISLWVENSYLTEINFKLLDFNKDIIFDQNLTVQPIAKTWWGTEYQIPLSSNFGIESGKKYTIILKGLNENRLNIFVKKTIELLQGSEEYFYFPETLIPARFNNSSTDYILKLSLYEGTENLPPQISNFQIKILEPRKVEVSFNSNEPIKYSFNYSIFNQATSTYEVNYFESCPAQIKKCLFNIETLPKSKYNFIFQAYDFWHNTTTLTGEFITPLEDILANNQSTIPSIQTPISSPNQLKEGFKPLLSQESQKKSQDLYLDKSTVSNQLKLKTVTSLQKSSNIETFTQPSAETSQGQKSNNFISTSYSTTISRSITTNWSKFYNKLFLFILIIIFALVIILKKIKK
jgi:hypothetical protein